MKLISKKIGPTAAVLAAFLATGCQQVSDWNRKPVVDARMQTYDGVVIKDEFLKCKSEASQREQHSSQSKDPSVYLAAARVYQACLEIRNVELYAPFEDRFKVSALSYVNYLKAGDLRSAREVGRGIEEQFPTHDLIFNDGTSFKDSLAALEIAESFDRQTSYRLNARPKLEAELTRLSDWVKQ